MSYLIAAIIVLGLLWGAFWAGLLALEARWPGAVLRVSFGGGVVALIAALAVMFDDD
jgi:hypothetical protein